MLPLTNHSLSTPMSKPVDSISLISCKQMHCSPFPPSSPLLCLNHFFPRLLSNVSFLHSCPSWIDSPYPVSKVIFLKYKLVIWLPWWNILNSRLPSMAYMTLVWPWVWLQLSSHVLIFHFSSHTKFLPVIQKMSYSLLGLTICWAPFLEHSPSFWILWFHTHN